MNSEVPTKTQLVIISAILVIGLQQGYTALRHKLDKYYEKKFETRLKQNLEVSETNQPTKIIAVEHAVSKSTQEIEIKQEIPKDLIIYKSNTGKYSWGVGTYRDTWLDYDTPEQAIEGWKIRNKYDIQRARTVWTPITNK